MIISYQNANIFISGLSYTLGSTQRSLDELQSENLLAGSVETLRQLGYRACYGLTPNETLLDLATASAGEALRSSGENPKTLFFQHGIVESLVVPWDSAEPDAATRKGYFAPSLMNALELGDVPYFSSFASGCAGFTFQLIAASGLVISSDETTPALCVMGDSRPPDAKFDLFRERILGSDHSSAFVVDREQAGFQVLGISSYSTPRSVVSLLELVKRSIEMIKGLAASLDVDLSRPDLLIHYPNIFPDTWARVTRSLRLSPSQQAIIDMPDRAHCGASDAVISLAKLHRGEEGRVHVVVTYGAGLHLGISILKEERRFSAASSNRTNG
ncbi:hypothetical protein BH18VER1_BH18VER1_02420 [soil metagenome]